MFSAGTGKHLLKRKKMSRLKAGLFLHHPVRENILKEDNEK